MSPLARLLGSGAGHRADVMARLPRLAAAILGLIVLLQIAAIVVELGPRPASGARPEGPVGAAEAARDADTPEGGLLARILAGNLFGSASSASREPAGTDTSLPLSLSGVIAGDDPGVGIAILGAVGGPARAYLAGSEISPGVVLAAVFPDRVDLTREGHHERLMLPQRRLASATSAAAAAPVVGFPEGDVPGLIGGLVNAQRTRGGFRLVANEDGQAFSQLGLRSGDVVTHVNGQALGDPETSERLLLAMAEIPQTLVTVRRGGKERQVTLDLQGALAAAQEQAALQRVMESVPPGDPVTRQRPREMTLE